MIKLDTAAYSTGNDFVALAPGDVNGSANTILIPEPSNFALAGLGLVLIQLVGGDCR